MRSKWLSSVMVAVVAMWPAAASACDLFGAYGAGGLGGADRSLALVGSIHILPGDDGGDTYMVPSAGLAVPLGTRITVAPVIGFCTGGDESEIVLGGFGSVNLISTEQWSLGVQSHVARTAYEGYSEMEIPVLAAATFPVGETARLYANAGLRFSRASFDDDALDSETESDPTAAAGVTLPVGSLGVTAGIILVNGDEDTDFSFGGRVTYALGG